MNNNHPDLDSLTGYVYRTIDDARRESIDSHLLNCQICRGRLSEQELRQRQISNDLKAAIDHVVPSDKMSFSAIASVLQSNSSKSSFRWTLSMSTPVLLALTGLFLVLFGFWQMAISTPVTTFVKQSIALPTVACFLLMLASVEQFDRALTIQPRLIVTWFIAITLWLGSAFIGLLDLIVIRDLAIMAVVAVDGEAAQAGPIAIMAVYIGVMLYIGLIFGGAEYHYRHIGQPSSWKLFNITLLGQLFLLILPYLIY